MRILFVSFGSSIHTARWISQLRDEKWDLHLFPVDPHYIHRDLREVTVHTLFKHRADHIHPSVRQSSLPWPFPRGKMRIRNALKHLPGDPGSGAARLARTIRALKPDIVHSMTVHGGILTLKSRERITGRFPPWIYSSWGPDFFYYATLPEFSSQIRAALGQCDYLMADCQRELDLAPSFGFRGEILGVFPGAGGYHIDQMLRYRQQPPVSSRRLIMLKGRQGDFGGRALVALQALHMCADVLREYEIVVYMPQGDGIVPYAAQYISFVTGLTVRVLPEHSPSEEILTLMGRARIAIGLGLVDGTPQAMLEAMVMGAFPIQSNSADTRGWIEDGQNGLLVPAEDANAIAAAIVKAVSDDRLVDQAAETNMRLTKERIDIGNLRPKLVEIYNRIAEEGRVRMN